MKHRNSTFNILMYSHDTYGLGHIRRTMAIATHLRATKVNVIILTGSPIVGRFIFPEQIDFVRIPGMIKKTNDEYMPMSIRINPRHALEIRKNIITATAKTFRPDLFIVDKEPGGLKKEVLPTLEWLRSCLPKARTILGLRDVMDESRVVREDWRKKRVYDILEHLYSEIWVYGNRELYDPIGEYDIPQSVSRKMVFTGYITRRVPGREAILQVRKEHGLSSRDKLVVVTTGGGGDGYAVLDTYLAMLESEPRALPFKSILITGPFLARQERKKVFDRARRLSGVTTYRFYRRMEEMLAAADLVVSMGGYNTLCEILSQKTVSLLIPRETPRKEQMIRAQILSSQHLADYIPWRELSSRSLLAKVMTLLEQPAPFHAAMANFKLTGLQVMRSRMRAFRCGHL